MKIDIYIKKFLQNFCQKNRTGKKIRNIVIKQLFSTLTIHLAHCQFTVEWTLIILHSSLVFIIHWKFIFMELKLFIIFSIIIRVNNEIQYVKHICDLTFISALILRIGYLQEFPLVCTIIALFIEVHLQIENLYK